MLTDKLNKNPGFVSQPVGVKRFTVFALLSMPFAAFVAALFAFAAAGGGASLSLPGEWLLILPRATLGGIAALISLMFLAGWAQFLMRMRSLFAKTKVSLAKEVAIFVSAAVAGPLLLILAWPQAIVKIYIEPGASNPAFHEYFFRIRGMKGETWYGATTPWSPFIVRLTEAERAALGVTRAVYRCGHVAEHEFAVFQWGAQLDFNNKPLRPSTVEQLQTNCTVGPAIQTRSAIANERLEKVTDDGAPSHIDESVLAVAEGRIADAMPMNEKSRYLLFLYYPEELSKIGAQISTPPNNAGNDSVANDQADQDPENAAALQDATDANRLAEHDAFLVEDHITATRACDINYARYLLSRGVRPEGRVVYVSALKAMGAYDAEVDPPRSLSPESEENHDVPAASGAACITLAQLYLEKAAPPYEYELIGQLIVSLNQIDLHALASEEQTVLLSLLQHAGSLELLTWANSNATDPIKQRISEVQPMQISKKVKRAEIRELPYGGDKLFAAWGE